MSFELLYLKLVINYFGSIHQSKVPHPKRRSGFAWIAGILRLQQSYAGAYFLWQA